MGEAYRGLTIKIGADTSKLQRSMNQLQSAMRSINADGRKLKSALATNPTSIELAKANMRQLSETTRGTATQVAYLRKSLDQAGMAGKSAAQIMQKFGSSDLKLASMRNSFTDLNTELERVWDKLRRFIAGTSDVNSEEWKEAAAYVTSLKTQLSTAEGKLRGLGERTEENAEKWDKWAQKVNEVKSGIKAAFTALGGKLPYGAENVEQVIEAFDRLRIAQKKQQEGLKTANLNVGIKNAAVDMQVFEEKVRATNAQLTETLAKERQLGEGAAREAALSMERFADSAREAKSVVSAMDEALRMDPANIEAAKEKMAALKDQALMVKYAIESLEERQNALNGADVDALRVKYGTLANAVAESGRALTNASTRADMLKGSLREAIASARNLREQMIAGNATGAQYEKAVAEVMELRHEYVSLKAAAKAANEEFNRANDGKALADTRHQLAALRAEYNGLNAAMQPTTERIASIGQSIRTFGYGLYSTITPAIMMTGMYMINAANDIDAAYRDMRKTVNGTEEDFEHLKDAAIEYSRSHVTSAKDMLEIEAIGGQLGVTVENLEKFGKVVSNLDIATNMDTETISENLGQLSAIMKDMDQDLQEGPGSMEAFSNALVRLGNNAPAQEDKIMNVMMRIASMGTVCDMTTPDLLGLATAVAATGQGSEAAGTAISKTFSQIESAVGGGAEALAKFGPVAEMNGEELAEYEEAIESSAGKLEKFAEVAGMSAQDFAQSWQNTPTEAFTAFIQGLKNIDESGGSAANTLSELGINSQRQRQTLLGLTNTIDNMNEYLTMSGDAWNGISDEWGNAGDAAYEAQQKSEGFSGQLEILKNNAKALAEEAAQGLVAPMQALTGVFQGLTGAVQALPDWLKTVTVSAVAVAGALGPLSVMVGSTMDGFAKISNFANRGKSAWDLVVKGANASADGMMTMSVAAKSSTGIVERFGTKVFDLGGKLSASSSRFAKFGSAVEKAGLAIGTLSGGAMLGIAAGITAAVVAVNLIIDAYNKWKTTQDNLVKSTQGMKDATNGVISLFQNGTDAVREYGEATGNASKSVEEFAETQAAHTDAIESIRSSYEDQLATLNTAQKYLDEYVGRSNLSAEEQGKLKTAIEWVNSACGTQYSVVDAANGVISDSAGNYESAAAAAGEYKKSIFETIEAKKQEAKVEALSETLKEQYKARAEAVKQYAEAQKKVADARKELEGKEGLALANDPAQNDLKEGLAEVEAAKDSIYTISDAIKSSEAAMGSAITTIKLASDAWREFEATQEGDLLNQYITNAGKNMDTFRNQMSELGLSVETLRGMSEEQLLALAESYDSNSASIVGALQAMGVEMKSLSEIKIGDQTFHIDDAGTIYSESANLGDLQDQILRTPDGYYTVEVDTETGEAHVNALGADIENLPDGKVIIDADTGTAYSDVAALKSAIDGATGSMGALAGASASPTVDSSQVLGIKAAADEAKSSMDTLDAANASPNVDSGSADYANGVVQSVINRMNELNGKYSTITIETIEKITKVQQAWGGLAPDMRVVAHAAGGYFVDRPTVIGRTGNVTHIAGEAGREYVSTHANGGVVLPLSDPYMRPWVNAVAQQMGGAFGGPTVNVSVDWRAGDDANVVATRIANAVSRKLAMEG